MLPGGERSIAPDLKTVCAWCEAVIREGEEPVSHGICKTCADEYFPWRKKERT